jgi:site-specific recombinase XerC
MEPLAQFLEYQKDNSSIFRVIHTNKTISYKQDAIDTLKKQFKSRTFPYTMHCCEFIGKFLAINGLVENKTGAPDSVYYTPVFLSEQGESIEYISLTEC